MQKMHLRGLPGQRMQNIGLYEFKLSKQTKAPTLPSSAAGSLVLCFDIDCDSGLEVNGEVILENGDLLNQTAYQRLIKFERIFCARSLMSLSSLSHKLKQFTAQQSDLFSRFCHARS